MHKQLSPGCFYGEISKKSEVAGLILHESLYPHHAKIAAHSHAHSYFSVVLDGTYRETYERKTRHCKPATVVFHPAGETHSDEFSDKGGRLFHLEVNRRWLEKLDEYAVKLNRPAHVQGGPLAWLASRLYKEFHQMDDVSPLAIEGLATELLAETSRCCKTLLYQEPPKWIKLARELVQEHFAENLSVAFVAQSVGVHPVHLCRAFRRFHSCTIGEFVRGLRVEFACVQLSTSQMPISQIAALAGFSDQSHFCKTFKGYLGVAPDQYRKRLSAKLIR